MYALKQHFQTEVKVLLWVINFVGQTHFKVKKEYNINRLEQNISECITLVKLLVYMYIYDVLGQDYIICFSLWVMVKAV